MSFRTLVVKSRAKLEYQLNYMIVRSDTYMRVHLSEISILIIENPAVAMTGILLCELAKRNIKVIFCDDKHNPCFECSPYYGNFETSKRIKNQINWEVKMKAVIWKQIIEEKIRNQMRLLNRERHFEASKLLEQYLQNVDEGDVTNREGHAAKVYFNALFGNDFTRSNKEDLRNIALNYGYSILLSAVNRVSASSGYLTQIGIWHDNEFNNFNLGSDLMEPFRPIVDSVLIKMGDESDFKSRMNNIMNVETYINGEKTRLSNALTIYLRSIFNALNTNNEYGLIFMESYDI